MSELLALADRCERREESPGWQICDRCGSCWSDGLHGLGWLPLSCHERNRPRIRARAAGMTVKNLTRFLALVKIANWKNPPAIWSDELRHSISDGLVTVGWGGVLELTDAGQAALSESPPQ